MTQYLGMPNDNGIMSPTWCTRSQLCSRRYSCRSSLAAAYELARSGSPRHKPENVILANVRSHNMSVLSNLCCENRLKAHRVQTPHNEQLLCLREIMRSWLTCHQVIPCTVAQGGRSSARMPGDSWGHPLASSDPRSWHQMMCRQRAQEANIGNDNGSHLVSRLTCTQ